MSDTEHQKTSQQEEDEKAHEEMRQFEEQDELPSDLKEWPSGKAKYVTFDNESGEAYGEGLTEKLGPPVTHHEDGSVSVNGEKVDNPEDYKGEPIPLSLQVEMNEERDKDESGGGERDAGHGGD